MYRAWLGLDWSLVPLHPILRLHAAAIAVAAAISIGLIGVGRLALRSAGVLPANRWEAVSLSISAGYGVSATIIFLLGIIGLWRKPVFILLGAVAVGLGLLAVRELSRPSQTTAEGGGIGTIGRLIVGALALVFLELIRLALAPETFFDALTYHLALPNLYLAKGGIFATPENSFSGIPSLPEMINGLALAFEPWGIAANLLHFSMPFWTALAFIGLAHRLRRPQAGPWAAATYLLVPVVVAEMGRVSVGLEWALMEVCFVTGLLAAIESPVESAARKRWLLLTGAFLGFCMSTKYPAFLLPLTLAAAMARCSSKREDGLSLLRPREAGLICLAAGCCVLPWLAKNAAFYRNPFYPFFHGLFGSQAAGSPDWHQIGTPTLAFGRFLTVRGLMSYLEHPWRFVISAEGIGASMGPHILGLLPAVFLVRKSGLERRLAAVCALAWIPLSLVSEIPRFFIPHIAVLGFFICYVVSGIDRTGLRRALFGAYGLVLTLFFLGLPLLTSLQRDRLSVYMGRMGLSEYLSHTRPGYGTPPFAAIEFVNRETPMDAGILMVGDVRSLYLNRNHVVSTPDQRPAIETWADASDSETALKAELLRRGITHIIFNYGELVRTGSKFHLTGKGKNNLDLLLARHAERVFKINDPGDRWLEVFRIRP
jgi:hypothetical protein